MPTIDKKPQENAATTSPAGSADPLVAALQQMVQRGPLPGSVAPNNRAQRRAEARQRRRR